MSVNPDVIERTVRTLQARLPGLLAVYGFGSRVQGTEGPDSDLDMAVLVPSVIWSIHGISRQHARNGMLPFSQVPCS